MDETSTNREGGVHVRRGGAGGPVIVLLHGLGATARVWDGLVQVLDAHWPGRWVAPDLAGHGRSAHRRPYSFGRYAAEVATLLEGPRVGDPPGGDPPAEEPRVEDPRAQDVHVVGHSMGGVVGLALASGWFGFPVRSVVGIGIKVSWTVEEIERATALARREAKSFPDRGEAVDRYLRVSGLAGLVDPAGPIALDGVTGGDAGWRLAQDPATFGVGVPDMAGLLAAARGAVVLAAGEHDPMSGIDDLRSLQRDAVRLDGLGHNAHVEDPRAVWDLLAATASGSRA